MLPDFIYSLTANPFFSVLQLEGHFVHLEHRASQVGSDTVELASKVIEALNSLDLNDEIGYLRLRKLLFNDKAGEYTVYIDHLYASQKEPVVEKDDIMSQLSSLGYFLLVEFRVLRAFFESDHFHTNHLDYYDDL